MGTREVTLSVRGMSISGVLHLPDRKSPPCVVACHGLLSNKDSIKYIELARWLAREGLALLRFDFLGCGASDGRLEDVTITGRLEELETAIGFVRTDPALGGAIGLMGSSLGGYLSLLKAAQEKAIGAVVTWATPYRFSGPSSELPHLSEPFYRDVTHYDLVPMLRHVQRCLVMHGDMDEVVPLTHAALIYENVREPKRLEVVTGADHRFTNPEHREKAYRLTTAWFNGHLSP